MWDAQTIADAPKGDVQARGRISLEDAECVLCGGPVGHGDWQVTLAKRRGGRREPAHTHCASDYGWTIR
jgi:hypothetical protein